MVQTCCVRGCNNKQYLGTYWSFHRIPTEGDLRAEWISAIGRPNWDPSYPAFVCSAHFKKTELIKSETDSEILQDGAVPSIFPPVITSYSNIISPVTTSSKEEVKYELEEISLSGTSDIRTDERSVVTMSDAESDSGSRASKPSTDSKKTPRVVKSVKTKTRTCYVCGPKSRDDGKTTFHPLPIKKKWKRAWLEALHCKEGRVPQNLLVCSKHFNPRCYTKEGELDEDALPTKYLPRQGKQLQESLTSKQRTSDEELPSRAEQTQAWLESVKKKREARKLRAELGRLKRTNALKERSTTPHTSKGGQKKRVIQDPYGLKLPRVEISYMERELADAKLPNLKAGKMTISQSSKPGPACSKNRRKQLLTTNDNLSVPTPTPPPKKKRHRKILRTTDDEDELEPIPDPPPKKLKHRKILRLSDDEDDFEPEHNLIDLTADPAPEKVAGPGGAACITKITPSKRHRPSLLVPATPVAPPPLVPVGATNLLFQTTVRSGAELKTVQNQPLPPSTMYRVIIPTSVNGLPIKPESVIQQISEKITEMHAEKLKKKLNKNQKKFSNVSTPTKPPPSNARRLVVTEAKEKGEAKESTSVPDSDHDYTSPVVDIASGSPEKKNYDNKNLIKGAKTNDAQPLQISSCYTLNSAGQYEPINGRIQPVTLAPSPNFNISTSTTLTTAKLIGPSQLVNIQSKSSGPPPLVNIQSKPSGSAPLVSIQPKQSGQLPLVQTKLSTPPPLVNIQPKPTEDQLKQLLSLPMILSGAPSSFQLSVANTKPINTTTMNSASTNTSLPPPTPKAVFKSDIDHKHCQYVLNKSKEHLRKKIKSLTQGKRRLINRLTKLTKTLSDLQKDGRNPRQAKKDIEHLIIIERTPKCQCSKNQDPLRPEPENLDDILKSAVGQQVPTPELSEKQVTERERLIRRIATYKRNWKDKDIVNVVVIQAMDLD